MGPDLWLEETTSALDAILRAEYGVHVDRAVLAHLVDRRRENIARSLQIRRDRVESLMSDGEVRDVAAMIANARRTSVA